jgi:carbamoyl-phosphate synthase large subunit
MKSVGEAMTIGRIFKESLQKCLRSLEIGRSGLGGDGKPWRIGTEVHGDRDILPRDVISRKLSVPQGQPESSQAQGGWSSARKIIPS